MAEYIVASILFSVALIMFGLSIRSFLEKGFLLNNAYLYASEQQRQQMNKKPYYRQTAVVFFLIGIILLLNGVGLLMNVEWMFVLVMAVLVVTAIYVAVSSVRIEREIKEGEFR